MVNGIITKCLSKTTQWGAMMLLVLSVQNVYAQQDTLVGCMPIQLHALPEVDNLEWSDELGHVLKINDEDGVLINDTAPWVAPEDTMIYTLKYVDQKNTNLIVNGDFETALSEAQAKVLSEYTYWPGFCNKGPGNFGISTSPAIFNAEWYRDIADHTKGDGTGTMFYADGGRGSEIVYHTTVSVEADKTYALVAWLANIHNDLLNPHHMDFYINNELIGELKGESIEGWYQYYGLWRSTINGNVEIKYVNKNTEGKGNDFALDDIVMAPVLERRVMVVPRKDPPVVHTQDISVDLGAELYVLITPEMIDDGSYVSCGDIDSMTVDRDTLSCTDLGDNVITLSVWCKGKLSSAEAIVTVYDPSKYCVFDIPKGFSPNSDGVNDRWVIDDVLHYAQVGVELYNRWGGLVFEEPNYQDVNKACDGKSNRGATSGDDLAEGTYYYILEVQDNGKVFRGSVYIAR